MPTLYDSGIRPIIDKHLAELSDQRRDYGDYWPASSAGYCLRKVIFDRLQVPYPAEDARKQRVFSSGHIFHIWIQGITEDAGLSVAQELELQDDQLMIKGHVDDLVLVDGQLILMDYKTAHSKWFEYAKSRPMSHYHRHQIGTYMWLVRKLQAEPVKLAELNNLPLVGEGRRLAISKDDLRLHEQQLLWSAELEQEITDYWQRLNDAWRAYQASGALPPCTCAQIEVNKRTGIGFMADEKWNPYWFNGQPCSELWFRQHQKRGLPM